VCCGVLQFVAMRCGVTRLELTHFTVVNQASGLILLQRVAVYYGALQCVAVHCSMTRSTPFLQKPQSCHLPIPLPIVFSALQRVAVYCGAL